MKRITVHVGTQKTGTTSLQAFLEKNRKRLAKQGFCYPAPAAKYPNAFTGRNAHFLIWLAREVTAPKKLTDELREVNVRNWKAFLEQVREADQVIISDETLWYEGAFRHGTWELVKFFLEDAGFDEIDIVVYLRRQDQFITSLWNQRVKGMMRLTSSCEEFVNTPKSQNMMDYSNVLSDLEEVFGREHITVRVFDREQLAQGDVRLDFCSLMGIEVDDSFKIARVQRNQGLSNNVAEIKRVANYVESYRESNNFLVEPARRVSAFPDAIDKSSPLPIEAREAIELRYAEGNARIAREYLGREDGELFAKPKHIAESWEFDTESYLRDVVRLFIDELSAERAALVAANKRIAKLEKRVKVLERRTEVLDSRTGWLALGKRVLSRVRRKPGKPSKPGKPGKPGKGTKPGKGGKGGKGKGGKGRKNRK